MGNGASKKGEERSPRGSKESSGHSSDDTPTNGRKKSVPRFVSVASRSTIEPSVEKQHQSMRNDQSGANPPSSSAGTDYPEAKYKPAKNQQQLGVFERGKWARMSPQGQRLESYIAFVAPDLNVDDGTTTGSPRAPAAPDAQGKSTVDMSPQENDLVLLDDKQEGNVAPSASHQRPSEDDADDSPLASPRPDDDALGPIVSSVSTSADPTPKQSIAPPMHPPSGRSSVPSSGQASPRRRQVSPPVLSIGRTRGISLDLETALPNDQLESAPDSEAVSPLWSAAEAIPKSRSIRFLSHPEDLDDHSKRMTPNGGALMDSARRPASLSNSVKNGDSSSRSRLVDPALFSSAMGHTPRKTRFSLSTVGSDGDLRSSERPSIASGEAGALIDQDDQDEPVEQSMHHSPPVQALQPNASHNVAHSSESSSEEKEPTSTALMPIGSMSTSTGSGSIPSTSNNQDDEPASLSHSNLALTNRNECGSESLNNTQTRLLPQQIDDSASLMSSAMI